MEAVRLFERGTWWAIELRECWHLTLLNVTLFQKSLGIPSKFSDIKGWKWIENVKYEPMCSWKGLAFTLKCQVMQSWKVLVTCVWNSWWWKMFLAWKWQGECSAIVKMSSASYSGTSLSLSRETLIKVVENPIMGPLVKFSWVHLHGACEINHQFWGEWCNSVTLLAQKWFGA